MKRILYIITLGLVSSLLSCNDDFMDRIPQTGIGESNFFNNTKDLETYTNGLYSQLGYSLNDVYSDNISIYTGGSTVDNSLRGQISPNNVGGWTKSIWGELRSINFFLVNAEKLEVTELESKVKNNHIGIARFLRARFYINMIQTYGMAPWYDRPISEIDTDLLTKGHDTRAFIVDKIMEDLEFAATNISEDVKSKTIISKYAGLHQLARFALYEGTYRKYHSELGLAESAKTFLEKAASASDEIIKTGLFDITGNGREGYKALFSSSDLSKNEEMILFVAFEKGMRTHNGSSVFNWQWQLSRSLADSYLMMDGTPATNDPAYSKKEFKDIFTNRDPRMLETIMPPGYISPDQTKPSKPSITFGLLAQIKYMPGVFADWGGYDANTNDLPIFRYAETLLIHAEAKAELGTLSSGDVQKTIDKLRTRVGLPALSMGVVVDPVLEKQYPNVSGSMKALILEIRRERRVELACEGLRQEDVFRWAAGNLIAESAKGTYIPAFGAYDITGDGVLDIAVLRDKKSTGPISHLTEEEIKALVITYLYGDDGKATEIYLSEGDKGYVMFEKDKSTPKKFESPKHYYMPLPFDQIRDNPNLTQPMGWDK